MQNPKKTCSSPSKFGQSPQVGGQSNTINVNPGFAKSIHMQSSCLQKHRTKKSNSAYTFYVDSQLFIIANIRPFVRSKMISWITTQCSSRNLMRETCALAIKYMDLFLMKNGEISVSNIQELGIACLILAAKFNQSRKKIHYCPKTFSPKNIYNFEFKIIKLNRFCINSPNVITLAQQIFRIWLEYIQGTQRPQFVPNIPFYYDRYSLISERQLFSKANQYLQFYELLSVCIACPILMNYDELDIVYGLLWFCISKQSSFLSFQQANKFHQFIYQIQKCNPEMIHGLVEAGFDDNLLNILKSIHNQFEKVKEEFAQESKNTINKLFASYSGCQFFSVLKLYQHVSPYAEKTIKVISLKHSKRADQ